MLKDGRLLGGESAWYYEDEYRIDGDDLTGHARMVHYGKPTSKSTAGHVPGQSPVDMIMEGKIVAPRRIALTVHPRDSDGRDRLPLEFRRMV